jgi:MIP family channel proteins
VAKKYFKEAYTNWRAYVAEFLGTFVFVFISLGAVLTNIFFGEVGVVGIALASGLMYAAMVFSTASISGGHINPVITLSLWFVHKMSSLEALLYIIAQVGAGFAAAGLLYFVFGSEAIDFSLGAQVVGGGLSLQSAIVTEALLTAFLVFGYFATMVSRRGPVSFGPLVLGFVISASVLVAGPLTGAVLNPAKVVGALVVSNSYNNLLVWIVGPAVGSIFGIVYEFIFLKKRAKASK